MKVWGLWNGGPEYRESSVHNNDVEEFRSLVHAKRIFEWRRNSHGLYKCDTFYTDRENKATYFPDVSKDSTMCVFFYDPREVDNGPDRIISFGLRGGIRVEKA